MIREGYYITRPPPPRAAKMGRKDNHNSTLLSASSPLDSSDHRDNTDRVQERYSDSDSTRAITPTVEEFDRRIKDSDTGEEETTRLLIDETMSLTRADSDKPSAIEEVELGGRLSDAEAATLTEEYKLYKRRFIGLGCLCLGNIAASWGWLTFAPVASLTVEWFKLESESPVNWISTVILLAYLVATP